MGAFPLRITNPLMVVEPEPSPAAHQNGSANGAATAERPYPMSTQTLLVTPAMAKEFLKGNVRNRRVSQTAVLRYADDMRNGRWVLTHQGIAFSREGVLVDGQHRLLALIEADTSILMTVTQGLNADAIMAIDQNRARKSHEQFTICGGLGHITHTHTAILRSMVAGLQNAPRRSMSDEYALMRKHHSAVQFAIDVMPTSIRNITVAPVRAAMARAYYCADREKIRAYASALTSGVCTAENGETVAILARWLIGSQNTTSGERWRIEVYGKTCRSLYAWLTGERIARLYVPSQELFVLPDAN